MNQLKRLLANRRGTVITEFLVVFPAFFLLCMLIIELSLYWTEKHFVQLAAFEAARSYISEEAIDPCFEPQNSGEVDKRAEMDRRAKRRAALKMAAVSNPIDYYLKSLGINFDTSKLSGLINTAGAVPKALSHLAVRLPAAFALTSVSCTYDASVGAVDVEVRYLRNAKMPFVQNALWGTYFLMRINQVIADQGLSGAVRYDLDDLFFRVEGHSPSLAEAQAKLNGVRKQVQQVFDTASNLSLGIGDTLTALDQVPGFDALGLDIAYFKTLEGQVSSRINSARTAVGGPVGQVTSSANGAINDAQGAINDTGRLLSKAIYAFPNALRLIPITAKARLVKHGPKDTNRKWQGKAFFVAPITTDANWRKWAHGMATTEEHIK